MDQNKGLARDTFTRARVSTKSLQQPSPETPARSPVHGQFRDRSVNSQENALRHAGITDRHDGALAIKRWQRDEIGEIDRRTSQAISQLRDQRDVEVEQGNQEWAKHKEKHDRLREDALKELGIVEVKPREAKLQRAEPEPDEIIAVRTAVEPETPLSLEPDHYVPDYHSPPPEHDFDFEMGD